MKRKLLRICLVLVVLLGLPLGLWRLYLAHAINTQLAAIRREGLPTNGEELNRWYPAVPDNQNAALVLTQAFALRSFYADSRSNLIFKFKLPKRGEVLSPEQAELLRGYLELNQAPLHKADEALRCAASRYPIDCSLLMSTPLPHLTGLKGMVELHQYAAFLAMDSRDPASATTNIVAMLALARTLDDEPSLISQLVRLRFARMAFTALERRASAAAFDSSELASLTAAFAQTRFTNMAARSLIGERAMTIPYFRMTRTEAAKLNPRRANDDSGPQSLLPCYGPPILRLIGYYELDYGSYLIGMNKAIELLDRPPPGNLRAGAYLARVGEASTERRRTLSGLLISSYVGVARRQNAGIAIQQIALAAMALEKFAHETGSLPQSLTEITPRFLAGVPDDPFSGSPLKYRRTDRGYVIYSVGPDRQDDGGLEVPPERQSSAKSFDITFVVQR